jgi:7-cyano-7-deazaguanine synthase in queuosine biosynthesis
MRSIVLYSGGLDSAVCLAREVADPTVSAVLALSFEYKQKNGDELGKAVELCRHWQVPHVIKSIDVGSGNTLTEIPARNLQFIVKGMEYAIINGYDRIVIGAEPDAVYLDSSIPYLDAVNAVCKLHKLELTWPVKRLANKVETLRWALVLGVPLDLVHSSLTNQVNRCNKSGLRYLEALNILFPNINAEQLLDLITQYHAAHLGGVFDVNGGFHMSFKFIPALFTYANLTEIPDSITVYTTGNWGLAMKKVFEMFVPMVDADIRIVTDIRDLVRNKYNTSSAVAQNGIKQALSRLPRPRYLRRDVSVQVTQGHFKKAVLDLGYQVSDGGIKLNTREVLCR